MRRAQLARLKLAGLIEAAGAKHWRLAVLDSASLRFEYCQEEEDRGKDTGVPGVPDAAWNAFEEDPVPEGTLLWQQLVKMYPQYQEGDGKYRAMLLNTLPEGNPRFERCPMLGVDVGDRVGILDSSERQRSWRTTGIRIFTSGD